MPPARLWLGSGSRYSWNFQLQTMLLHHLLVVHEHFGICRYDNHIMCAHLELAAAEAAEGGADAASMALAGQRQQVWSAFVLQCMLKYINYFLPKVVQHLES